MDIQRLERTIRTELMPDKSHYNQCSVLLFDENGNKLLSQGPFDLTETELNSLRAFTEHKNSMFTSKIKHSNYICLVNSEGLLIGRGRFNSEKENGIQNERHGDFDSKNNHNGDSDSENNRQSDSDSEIKRCGNFDSEIRRHSDHNSKINHRGVSDSEIKRHGHEEQSAEQVTIAMRHVAGHTVIVTCSGSYERRSVIAGINAIARQLQEHTEEETN